MIDSFTDQVVAEDIEAERAAVEGLRTLYGIKQGRHEFEKAEKEARIPIDNWFLGHPYEKELRDTELGYVAKLQSGGTSMQYERARLIRENAVSLFNRLLSLDCLVVDHDAVKRAIADGDLVTGDVDHYRHSVERSSRMLVERTRE